MSLKSIWRKRAELAADAAFAAKHPMPGADGWVENPFDKLDAVGQAMSGTEDINEALKLGYSTTPRTLRVESLEATLRVLTFNQKAPK